MTASFDPTQGLIIVEARIVGPTNNATLNLAVDTGATTTFVEEAVLAFIGYTQADATNKFDVLTASGIGTVLEVPARSLTALGETRGGFPIQSHTFPPGTSHDGVLGLDFFRGNVLTIEFVKGEITLAPGSAARTTP
jgi:gag-polyprotein putative aspartyl protease